MNWKHVSAAAAVLAAALGATPAVAQNAEGVAAIVNDHVISTFDVRQRATLLLVSAGIDATPEMQQRARAQALRDLVDERLQLQETAKFDITVTPDTIDRRLADIARQNETTVEGLAQSLGRAGVNIRTLRTQIEADIAWQRLISGMYGTRVRVSEVEIRETQQRIAANATRPQYQISEIFLPAETEQEFTEMQQGAMRLLEHMQRGAPFPAVARQFSQAPSAAAGGDIGWIAAPELAPELQPIAEQLQPGQVSLPVRTQTGVYIIAMRDRRAGADAGATSIVSLRQISAPAARQAALERVQRRIEGCGNLDNSISGVQGAEVADLGQTQESELSPAIRDRINGVAVGRASPVIVDGERVNTIVVCARETGGGGIPDRQQIEDRLREQELTMLSERYLRNLRREATIINRTQ
ncbi:MAG TPA: peptidylprolyl isomerase [Vitreimonas sp.]|uniref:peptidylprolyl isomerase n=1 Tax=Vitreimonas sp. TaxID=3069702 RepID=UPI002D5ACCFF|nr:peptidylprolyl isomerase [Vitreimonas sp.]HYD89506.1 peptidylprolyl isomerase [Vitreimonas sp.]